MRHLALPVLLTATVAAPLCAQARFARLEVRVTAERAAGRVVVDRGATDNVRTGDLVFLHPAGGGSFRGAIVRTSPRTATVEMRDKTLRPRIGTRGVVLIPKDRKVPRPEPARAAPTRSTREDRDAHPGWQNRDEGYVQGKPLLSGMKPVRPEERAMQISGRYWAIGDLAHRPGGGFDDSFLRTGGAVVADNPLGRGGRLQADAEFNHKTERNDKRGVDLLVRRLSYAWGGNRFQDQRVEGGRFLQNGMPEFGVLDGIEWGRRRDNGDRYGFSFGFLPEPTDDFDTLRDLQLAGYYMWAFDSAEQLTAGIGFQKSFHDGKTDRDLFVGKIRHLPDDGWDFDATLWVDYHYGKDDIKGTGLDLTQAVASLGRTWDDRGIAFTYQHIEFPQILRDEFLPVIELELARNRYDRLSVNAWQRLATGTRLHGFGSVWNDEDGNGASLEVGMDVPNLIGTRTRTDFVLFGTLGDFASIYGLRIQATRELDNGRWDLFYEIANHDQIGFPSDRNDLLQHRLFGSRSFFSTSGWDLSLRAEGRVQDDDFAWSTGFYMQKTF